METWQQGRLPNGAGEMLAWRCLPGRDPAVVFLPGFRSTMAGEKATALAGWCAARGQALLLFDYSGHGASSGAFTDGTVGRWRADTLAVIDALTAGPLILVGSSMGGWIALLAALARPDRVAGLVGVAAAPDFTETLMWDAMLPAERRTLLGQGVLEIPNRYGDTPTPVTRGLVEDGRRHLLLDGPIRLRCPVRLLHGQADPDVPWQTALRLAEAIEGPDVHVHLVKDGGHRLSRPGDLRLIEAAVAGLQAAANAADIG